MRAEDPYRRGARERHLPKRPTDYVEGITAWVLTSCGLIATIIAFMIGQGAYRSMAETARAESADRTEVPAVLVTDAPSRPDPDGRGSYPVTAQVRWTGDDGVERVGETHVRGQHSTGDHVVVWVDPNNRLMPAPTNSSDALLAAFVLGGLVLVGATTALAVVWRGVRRWALHRNCARWEREWMNIEPIWSGRIRGSP